MLTAPRRGRPSRLIRRRERRTRKPRAVGSRRLRSPRANRWKVRGSHRGRDETLSFARGDAVAHRSGRRAVSTTREHFRRSGERRRRAPPDAPSRFRFDSPSPSVAPPRVSGRWTTSTPKTAPVRSTAASFAADDGGIDPDHRRRRSHRRRRYQRANVQSIHRRRDPLGAVRDVASTSSNCARGETFDGAVAATRVSRPRSERPRDGVRSARRLPRRAKGDVRRVRRSRGRAGGSRRTRRGVPFLVPRLARWSLWKGHALALRESDAESSSFPGRDENVLFAARDAARRLARAAVDWPRVRR